MAKSGASSPGRPLTLTAACIRLATGRRGRCPSPDHDHGGEFVLPVKENRQALFDALDALPWGQVPIAHTATDKGHGRITTRTIQVLPAPEDLPFPHVNQVFLIERHVTSYPC